MRSEAMSDIQNLIKLAVRNDFLAQFETFLKVEDKATGNLEHPKANIHQQRLAEVDEVARSLNRPCRIIGLKPRQKGSSTASVGMGYVRLKRKRAKGLIAGGAHFQGQNLFGMLGTYAATDELDPGMCKVMDKDARFSNGSLMTRITLATESPGRSGTYRFMLVTEAALLARDGVANADNVLDGLLKCVPYEPDTTIILESTAYGACYDKETEVLTDQGWKLFSDLDGSEAILTKDPSTNDVYYQPEWKHQVHRHKGEMVVFEGSNVNLRVTPNHSMWMARQKGKMKMSRADSVRGRSTDYYFERKLGNWKAEGMESVTIPAYRHRQGAGWRTLEEKVVPIDVWLKFLGHFLTDGHVTWNDGNKRVVLTQVKFQDAFRESAQAMAAAMGCEVREEKHENGIRLSLINAQLASYLKDFTQPKRIPRDLLMGLSRDQCRKFIGWLYDGDGCHHRRDSANENGKDYGRIYAGVDKGFSDDLQELYLKAGYGAAERVKRVSDPNHNDTYIASFTHEDRACLKCSNPPRFEDGCDETVYCVTLPKDHLLMVRRRGQSVWCGNSGYFYDVWQGGITIDEFKAGKSGYVKVFSAWYEFADSRRDPASVDIYGWDSLRPDEVAYFDDLRDRLGVTVDLEQAAWVRWAVKEECKGDWDKFRQDYPSDDVTAFLTSGRCVFAAEAIRHQERVAGERPREFGRLEYHERGDRVNWIGCPEGQATCVRWEHPRVGCTYTISVDVMTGADQAGGDDPDSHSILVHREGYLQNGRWIEPALVMRNIMVPGSKPGSLCCWWNIDVVEELVWRMARYYQAVVVPEMNMDRGLVELLKLRGDVEIYEREMFNRREQVRTKALGWVTDVKTRPMIIEKLAGTLREAGRGEIGAGYEVRCPWIIQQLKNFGTKPNGRMEALVGKDDDVLSLAIGNYTLGCGIPWRERTVSDDWLPPDLRGASRVGARRCV